jgi:hypothetical protein
MTTPIDGLDAAGLVVGLLAAYEVVPRLIVRRRQPFQHADPLRADDALRSWSAHAVTGVLLASMLGAMSIQVGEFRWAELTMLRWFAVPVGFGLMLVAVGSFQLLSSYSWRWRVPTGPSPAAGPA